MGSIKSTLELVDKVTKPLDSINSKLGISIEKFDDAGDSADKMGNKAGSAADSARVKVGRFAMTLDSIPKGLNSVGNAMQSVGTRSNSMFKAMLGVAAVQKVLGMVTNQMGNAVERMDTLNNFPKVMENLGISSKASEETIDDMSERLKGLPTTLQDAAASVQRFTSANGDVRRSKEMFLALNNAILAGGADMQTQQSALEQLSQSYAKGKPDMMEWRSAMTAMPAQLKQVAQAMGYVSADELGESLRKGEVSMDEFMATMVKMNKESVAGFRSLEEQAKAATGGFATSIANMKSAVTRGLTGMVEGINDALSNSGLPTIQEMISKIGETIEKVLKAIGKVFGKVIAWIAENKEEILGWIKTIVSVAVAWGVVSAAVSALVGIIQFCQTVVSIFGGVFSAVFGVAAIAGVIAIANGISGLIDWIGDLNDKTGDIGKTMEIVFANVKVVLLKIKKWFTIVVGAIKTVWDSMCLALTSAFRAAAGVILTILGGIVKAFEWVVNKLRVTDDLGQQVVDKFKDMTPEQRRAAGITDEQWQGFQNLANSSFDTDWDDIFLNSAKDEFKGIVDDTLDTANGIMSIGQDIKDTENDITRAEADAKAIEDRYTRNLGNDRTGPGGTKKPGKGKTDPVTASVASNTAKTAANTKNISKQLAVNGETLKYLKDYATQRAINRYTSSTIKVDMKNNNNINNEMDIDGVVSGLKLRLERELATTAAGVHA